MASSIFAVGRVAALSLAAGVPAFAQVPELAPATLSAVGSGAVRAWLDANGSPQPLCATSDGRAIWAAVQAFYAARGDRPVWLDGLRLSPAGARLVAALRAAGDDGLDPSRYQPAELAGARPDFLRASIGTAPSGEAAATEVGLTAALARFAADLGRGGVDPSRVSVLWRLRPRRPFDVLPVLQAAAVTSRPDLALDAIRPVHPQYAALRQALRAHAALSAIEAKVPTLPAGLQLRPGARSPQVPALRARLRFWGDLKGPLPSGDALDRPLFDALRRFQARHGLPADGVVGPAVVAALNTPVRDRVRQIVLNLERWRWQEPPSADRSVLVNIPTFELHAYEGAREALAMRVIVGKTESPTPVFAQDMTSVVLSPYWTVPANMAEAETLPAVRRDRAYLRRMNLEVLRGDEVVDPRRVDWSRDRDRLSFRQRPGPSNSLGLVKFVLPNPFNVYLHDTPSEALFLRPLRAFSHGCVRLEKPEELARWVLAGRADWTRERIAAGMRAGREEVVPLLDPVPVSIAYFTVWVDGDGTVEFRPDVYRHDAAQAPLFDVPEAPAPAQAVLAAAG